MKRHLPPAAHAWRNAVGWEAIAEARRQNLPVACFDGSYLGPVGLSIELYGTMCDWDNGGKEISDALEKIVMTNDRQIINARVKFPHRVMTERGTVTKPDKLEQSGAYVIVVWFDL
jgi:hypothetical protein